MNSEEEPKYRKVSKQTGPWEIWYKFPRIFWDDQWRKLRGYKTKRQRDMALAQLYKQSFKPEYKAVDPSL